MFSWQQVKIDKTNKISTALVRVGKVVFNKYKFRIKEVCFLKIRLLSRLMVVSEVFWLNHIYETIAIATNLYLTCSEIEDYKGM